MRKDHSFRGLKLDRVKLQFLHSTIHADCRCMELGIGECDVKLETVGEKEIPEPGLTHLIQLNQRSGDCIV